MAGSAEDESLETWLNKATNPLMKEEDWEAIVGFCDQVNKELEGPQTAVRLLIHKIQSPQEKESLLALTTLEACVKNCGKRFQQEIGKFRFINEIIKVVSPKYLGNHMTDKVKQKCIELLFSWSQVLTHEPKIKEAYQMLRRQGIIKQDPVFLDQTLEPPPPPPARNSIFDDEEKSKLLSRLLKSKNPEDLQAANRLIKNMVKQETERTEKVSRRVHQLETVSNNVKLLSEMLNNHQPESSTESDREIMKELFDNLEKQRPNLFRLASDTDENDSTGISDILKANDEVVQVMALYNQVVNNATVANLLEPGEKREEKQSFLKDLEFLSNSAPSSLTAPSYPKFESQTSSLLDVQLLSLGLENTTTLNGLTSDAHGSQVDNFDDIFGPVISADSKSASSDLFSLPPGTQTSSFGFSSSASISNDPLDVSVTSSLSSSTHGMLKTSFPAAAAVPFAATAGTGFGANPSFGAPIIPVAAGVKGDLFSSSSQTAAKSMVSHDLSDLFRPTNTNSDASILGGESTAAPKTTAAAAKVTSAGLDYLNELSRSLLEQSLSSSGLRPYQPAPPVPKVPLAQLTKHPVAASSSGSSSLASVASTVNASTALPPSSISPIPTPPLMSTPLKHPGTGLDEGVDSSDKKSLTDIFVPLEKIRPGSQAPIIAYDKNNLKVVFYMGKDRPRPDVQVFAITTTTTSPTPIKNFSFLAAVPKVMKIQLQPASATDLAAYNPILPPSAITQVMLVSHPPHEKIRLKFKITYSINEAIATDVGEVEEIAVE